MRAHTLMVLLFLLLSPGLAEDTVAEDLNVQQLSQMVELLTAEECKNFLDLLSHREESILQRIERLSPKAGQLPLPNGSLRRRRTAGQKTLCQDSLLEWLLAHGKQIYYDRLSRTLMQIGRTDIAKEVAKNINQDKILSLQRYVEGYHQSMAAAESSLVQPVETRSQKAETQGTERQVRDPRDLELVVVHERRPPYSRHLLTGTLPLVYGILLGFLGTILTGVPIVLFVLHISRSDMEKLLKKPCKRQIRPFLQS
ncbi:transmembrane and death domain protein 1 [Scleropages formosus]|uniref:transmembrane and death domain protein 1 n=1 Tax=Scleropages formosus TaxID=113540 RepID=UPI0010FA98A6|nr:uncharacterized protein C12orf81-like [Scleropages formosus]